QSGSSSQRPLGLSARVAFWRSVRLHIRQGDFASGGLVFGFQKLDDLSNLAPSPSRNFILLIADPGGGGGSGKGAQYRFLCRSGPSGRVDLYASQVCAPMFSFFRRRKEADATARRIINQGCFLGARTAREAVEMLWGRPLTENEWDRYCQCMGAHLAREPEG